MLELSTVEVNYKIINGGRFLPCSGVVFFAEPNSRYCAVLLVDGSSIAGHIIGDSSTFSYQPDRHLTK